MAMATGSQNKSSRHSNPNIYETCGHLNKTQKTEQGKGQIYDSYGHRLTKQIQNINIYKIYEQLKHEQKTEPGKGKIYNGYGHLRANQILK